MNKERLLTTEEKGNEIIEMCKEHGMTDLVFSKDYNVRTIRHIRDYSKINVSVRV